MAVCDALSSCIAEADCDSVIVRAFEVGKLVLTKRPRCGWMWAKLCGDARLGAGDALVTVEIQCSGQPSNGALYASL